MESGKSVSLHLHSKTYRILFCNIRLFHLICCYDYYCFSHQHFGLKSHIKKWLSLCNVLLATLKINLFFFKLFMGKYRNWEKSTIYIQWRWRKAVFKDTQILSLQIEIMNCARMWAHFTRWNHIFTAISTWYESSFKHFWLATRGLTKKYQQQFLKAAVYQMYL